MSHAVESTSVDQLGTDAVDQEPKKDGLLTIKGQHLQGPDSTRNFEHHPRAEPASTSGRSVGVATDEALERRSSRQFSVPNLQIPASDDVFFESLLRIMDGSSNPESRKAVVDDGWATHAWTDGCDYTGEWLDGLPNGRGRFSWPTGDAYEGEWKNGLHHGVGTFLCRNGSTYYGGWLNGKQHGEGVFKPSNSDNRHAEVIFLQEYVNGQLVHESVLRVDEMDVRKIEEKKKSKKQKGNDKRGKDGMLNSTAEKPLPRPGVPVDKQHHHYNLMRQLQLGIMFSIARAGRIRVKPKNDGLVSDEEFRLNVEQYFPGGANTTSFKWKDYSPTVFQRLRHLFSIDATDYLLSLTGEKSLRLKQSEGKSGCMFFLSEDDQYLIKTVRKEEMQLLMELVPKYFAHVENNPHTLLTRFYGVHRIRSTLTGQSVRFIVMGNVFPTDIVLHRKYDLKGSSYKRSVGQAKMQDRNAVLKDLDVDFKLLLESRMHDALMSQLHSDVDMLRALKVMDYSLLLGMHVMEWGNDAMKWQPPERTPGDDLRRGRILRAHRKHDKRETPPLHERFVCCAPRFAHTKSIYRQNTFRSQELQRSIDGSRPMISSEKDTGPPFDAAIQAITISSGPVSDASLSTPQTNAVATNLPAGPTPREHQLDAIPADNNGKMASPFGQVIDASDTEGDTDLETTPPGRFWLPPVRRPTVDPTVSSKVSELLQQFERCRFRQGENVQSPGLSDGDGGDGDRETLDTGTSTSGTEQERATGESARQIGNSDARNMLPWVRQVLESQKQGPGDGFGRTNDQGGAREASARMRSNSRSNLVSSPSGQHRRVGSVEAMEPRELFAQSAVNLQFASAPCILDTPSAPVPPNSPYRGANVKLFHDQLLQPFRDAFSDMSETLDEDIRNMAKVPSLCDRCGAAVPAVAISKTGAFKPRAVLLYFGIIDFLQDYNLRKRLEHMLKSTVHDSNSISVVHPTQYSLRFVDFMGNVFVKKKA